jgi:hypothetical protein
VIDIISLLSVDTVFYIPHEQRENAAEARKKFTVRDGKLFYYFIYLSYL